MTTRLSLGLRNMMAGINSEKIINGGFGTVTDNWTASAGTATLASVASGQSGNCLQVTEVGAAAVGQAYQAVTVKVGHLYKFTGYFKKGTATSGKFLIGTTSAGGGTVLYDSGALTDADWALKTGYFVPTTTTIYIVCETSQTTATTSLFDTLSLVCLSRSWQDVFRYSHIKWYTGTQPATPQLAPTGTLVCTMKNGASGMTFDDATAGALIKPAAETWSGVCEAAGGTVGWARLSHVDDTGTENDLDARIDFRVSTAGAEANFESVAWGGGSTQGITSLPITMPMSA